MKIRTTLFLFALLGSLGFSWPFSWLFSGGVNGEQPGTNSWVEREIQILKSQAGNIDTKVLRLSLIAYSKAKQKGITDNKQVLTVIDYSKPSTEKRLWVFDLKRGRTLFNTLVSHGKNSGGVASSSFSNSPGSLKSSIGVFVTDEPYIGKNGYSLRLRGLERGVNDNAYRRSVVIHGAWYATPDTLKRYGQIGRSWGCPAVSQDLAKPLINTIKENTLIFAYYPDRNWLSHSRFLT
ncbi:murein L,D-transpeptidase catalytic domain family protein [Aquicella lusitana]|uniref:L,D-transpeptidase-like protein n=1 Tax=Aquicella lusitana TaxID=254246 RepID=A0A370GSB5_9COXI|nr:murein L,D-transpeptidase catalytic domain family protein [Aquicella lusitana]RDI46595.1 L,D-transpeptidase-like protein [Aquicella lusitana]VVC74259.1 hypothetical protein AQULUS_20240 [Aquicella lusitana]